MKQFLKAFLALHVAVYRLTGGRFGGSMRGFKVLLLTTTGRKTGKTRTLPLGFIEDKGTYVICASNGGQDTHPSWYFNLMNQPAVTIEVMTQTIKATADITSGAERKRLWDALMAEAPAYRDYETSTTREIPMVVLRPITQV